MDPNNNPLLPDEAPASHAVPASHAAPPRGRSLRATVLAIGAAAGMTLAGLGVASAQISAEPSPEASTRGPGEGKHAGDMAARGRKGHGPGAHFVDLTTAAKAIGVGEPELRRELRDGKSIAQVAESNGVSVDAVIAALVDDAEAHIGEHLAAGRVTDEEAQKLSANLEERITKMVHRSRDGQSSRPGPANVKPRVTAAARTLGTSEKELLVALRSGQSLAQLAEAKGISVDVVITALIDEAKAQLAAKVTAGELTQVEADERASKLEERITKMVHGERRREHRQKAPGAARGARSTAVHGSGAAA